MCGGMPAPDPTQVLFRPINQPILINMFGGRLIGPGVAAHGHADGVPLAITSLGRGGPYPDGGGRTRPDWRETRGCRRVRHSSSDLSCLGSVPLTTPRLEPAYLKEVANVRVL
jgi:hypothetical protein